MDSKSFGMNLGGEVYAMVDSTPLGFGANVNNTFPMPAFHLLGMEYAREFGDERETTINYA
jgi:hypothetical protein